MFKKVDPKQSFPKMEEEILKFWDENKIFEKSVEKNSPDKSFVFYEGPPTANGVPGLHHVLARAFKDIIPRYKTMKGFRVERKAGWDTHGLPVELQVEKALGLRNKQDIENIVPGDKRQSIIEFNKKCKESVWEYKDLWEKLTRRMGYWVDMQNPYVTYENKYIESVWWVIAQIFKAKNDKGESLVYKGHKVIPYCYRCGTALSSHEVAQGYQTIKDNSVYIKFKAKYRAGKTGRGIGAIIKNAKGEILLLRRNEEGRRVTWALVGGKVDQGENFEEALKREVKEEVGVEIKSFNVFSSQVDIFEGRLFETVGYEIKIEGEPKIMVPNEVDKLEWFSLDKLPEIDYPPAKKIIEAYKNKKEEFIVTPDIERPLSEVYFLAWTTTPWTLPGNVALAISPNILYAMVKSGNEFYILAKDLVDKAFENIEHEFIRDIEAKDVIGLEYEPLYTVENKENKKAHYIIGGDFVTTTDGTGIVHIAPAFGEDDANVGKENNLPTLLTVDEEGKIISGFDIPGEGIPVKKKNGAGKFEADELIVEDLKKRELFFKDELYEHEYPFCWRCDTPLIYYAKPSWFIRMSELSEDLVKNNENINWIPEYIKEGRFGEWLRGVKDWAISRERYWGTPLPLWQCECGEIKVIESQKELEELSGQKLDDLHKPFIDDVKFKCSCGKEMTRTPEVLDVWFDSGSMPLAQFHYPNGASEEDKKKIESGKVYPADFISEAIDQTRGWFYTLHAISTLLYKFGKVPTGYAFKNVICLAHILDAKGKKMSKSKGNIVDPMQIMDEYGSDMLRWMLFSMNQPGQAKKFDVKGMKDIMNRVFRMLWNSYSFFVMYANIDNFKSSTNQKPKTTNLLDKWIISELNILIKDVDAKLNQYDIYSSAKNIENFIDNLSNWYIRRSRKRFWKSEDDGDKKAAYETLHYVLAELSKLMAPFCPFIAEEIYKNLTGEESVHLTDFPSVDESLIDEKLNEEMGKARSIITEALQLRAKAGIKVRQPLLELRFKNYDLRKELVEIIKEEVNVRSASFNKEIKEELELNTEITEELKLEGQAREIIRFIQEMRKEAGYDVENRISVSYQGMEKVFEKFGELIAKEVLANEIKSKKLEESDAEKEFNVDGEKVTIQIKR